MSKKGDPESTQREEEPGRESEKLLSPTTGVPERPPDPQYEAFTDTIPRLKSKGSQKFRDFERGGRE